MADTGAPYFIPYVEPTDLVREYPAANEAMALAIVAALEDIPVTIKKVDAFTGSGTFVVPAGVTYAIAHMKGGGGGMGTSNTGGAGAASSVAFASGTVSANGGTRVSYPAATAGGELAGQPNSGYSAVYATSPAGTGRSMGPVDSSEGAVIVAGASVTPAAEIAVTVGAGGAAGNGGQPGGSGYVYIEYFEEV